MKKHIKLIAAATAALVITGNAATVSTDTSAPGVNGLDESNLTATNGAFKWFNDGGHNLGQTFTSATGGMLTSFTIRLATNGANEDDGPDTINFRFGTISRPGAVFTFTDIIGSPGEASPQFTSGDWDGLDYVTYTINAPQTLAAGVEYGIILDNIQAGNWNGPGIPYTEKTSNVYAGGVAIYGGSYAAPGEQANSDLVFHANIDAVPEPATTALLGLGGLALILRRRK